MIITAVKCEPAFVQTLVRKEQMQLLFLSFVVG